VKALQPKGSLVAHPVRKEGSFKRAQMQTGMDSPSNPRGQKKAAGRPRRSDEKAVPSRKESLPGPLLPSKAHKNHSLLTQPLLLMADSPLALKVKVTHTEILCKRMSWIVAQTIVKQLSSVVNTSI
jgi:hypothetical protein